MDLVQRKHQEAAAKKEKAAEMRRKSEGKQFLANAKRQEHAIMSDKARESARQAEELKKAIASMRHRISNYQRQADASQMDMLTSERAIDQKKEKISRQKALIVSRRAEAARLKQEAERLRREADSSCMPGLHLREIGNNARARVLLEQAEAKQREAIAKVKEADDLERLEADGTRNLKRLCDQLLVQGRLRKDNEDIKEREGRRVAEMSEKLEKCKREADNFETAAREMTDAASQLQREYQRIKEEADSLDNQARAAEEEANQKAAGGAYGFDGGADGASGFDGGSGGANRYGGGTGGCSAGGGLCGSGWA